MTTSPPHIPSPHLHPITNLPITPLLPINDTPAVACPHHRADADAKVEMDELWG